MFDFERRKRVKRYFTALESMEENNVLDANIREEFISGVLSGAPRWFSVVVSMSYVKEELPDGRKRVYFVFPPIKQVMKDIKEYEHEYNSSRRPS